MLRTKDFEHVFFYEMCEDSFIEIKVNYAYFLTFVNNHTARITINIISHDDAPSLPVNTWSFKEGELVHVRVIFCRKTAFTCYVSIEVLPINPLFLAACVTCT